MAEKSCWTSSSAVKRLVGSLVLDIIVLVMNMSMYSSLQGKGSIAIALPGRSRMSKPEAIPRYHIRYEASRNQRAGRRMRNGSVSRRPKNESKTDSRTVCKCISEMKDRI